MASFRSRAINGSGTERRRSLRFSLAVASLMLFFDLSCRDKSKNEGASLPPATSTAQQQVASSQTGTSRPAPDASVDHSTDDCTLHSEPRPPLPPGAKATALDDSSRDKLTKIRVSAHVGVVTIRKQGAQWVISGKRGCTLSPARINAALDNLSSLKGTPSDESPPKGSAFELQIDLLMDETHAIHFEVARSGANGDLVRLLDDSIVKLQGLDHELWSPKIADWCGTAR